MVNTTTSLCHCISMSSLVFTVLWCDEPVLVQQRDRSKRSICEAQGITLIVIPYFWNKKMESVANTLHMTRPDIPIPSTLLTGDVILELPPPPSKGTTKVHADDVEHTYYPQRVTHVQ